MIELFQLEFMQRAFIAGVIVAIMAPFVGIFMVVRRYSLMADTLAHVSLVGIAIGFLTNTFPVAWATIISVLTAWGIERLQSTGKVLGESAVALFFWGGMALAVVLLSAGKSFNADLNSFLFGSITTVSQSDVYFIAALAFVVLSVIIAFYKEIFCVSLDEDYALACGVNPANYNVLIVSLTAITVSIAMRIVGMLLIGALMVIPVMTAMIYARSFKRTIAIAVGFSVFSILAGLLLSYYLDLASGGLTVLIAIALFLLSLTYRKLFISSPSR